ncbi:hypothetical protein D3C86_1139530 [compost metagenome]
MIEGLASGHRHSHPIRRLASRWRGANAANRTGLGALDQESVPVVAEGLEALDLDVDRVRQFGPRVCFAGLDDPSEALVFSHLPPHRDDSRRHAAMGFERLGRQAGPQDETVGPRVARGDPQREGIAAEAIRAPGPGLQADPADEGQAARGGQKFAPIHCKAGHQKRTRMPVVRFLPPWM